MRSLLILASLVHVLVTGCSNSTTTLDLQAVALWSEPEVRTDPIAQARIRAIPLQLSAVPLPVTSENLKDASIAPGSGGITDNEGRITIRVDSTTLYEIQVVPSPFHALADRGVRRWRYDPVTGSLEQTDHFPTDEQPWISLLIDAQ